MKLELWNRAGLPSKCHGLWDNQKPDGTFAASGFLKRMGGRF